MQTITNVTLKFEAVIGDLEHKLDVYMQFGRTDKEVVDKFLTNAQQAWWLRTFRRDLVPADNPNGVPPSDHTVSTVFEANYCRPLFRFEYLRWLRTQDV